MALAWLVLGCAEEGGTSALLDDVSATLADRDQDGVTVEADCDDLDPSAAPGALERCDGLDNDCDGRVDESEVGSVCAVELRVVAAGSLDALVVVDGVKATDAVVDAVRAFAYGLGEVDGQLGVVSLADPGLRAPRGGPPWRAVAAPDLAEWLTAALAAPSAPVGERGVRDAILALVEAGAPSLRGGDALEILVFTDREDPSAADDDALLAALEPWVGSVVVDVVAPDGACGEPATSLVELAMLTGGIVASACDPPWTQPFARAGEDAAARAVPMSYRLELPARLGTVEVTVDDGVAVAPYDGPVSLLDPYTVLLGGSPPPTGATLVVRYELDYAIVGG